VEFMVPKDISYQVAPGKISMYAENGVTDASGFYQVLIGGSEQLVIADKTGPGIRLFLNDTTFRSGGVVASDALALAFLRDANGINATGNGIGRDLLLFVDKGTPQEQVFVVNDYYTADINSFSSGSIRFPLQNLSMGMHTLTLRVWDIFNNSSEASIQMLVSARGIFTVSQVIPFPNPAEPGQEISFLVEHNAAGEDLEATLIITDAVGRELHRETTSIRQAAARSGALRWKPSNGMPGNGLFFYKIILSTASGESSMHHGRIISTQNAR
ncbi:MAG: type secretion system sortase PorU, partial [Bacteroidota bacterium]